MNQSLLLKLATVLVLADLKREEREWKRRVKRSQTNIPWTNNHMLRDIGLDFDRRAIESDVPDAVKAERRVRHIRRVLNARIPT